MYRSAFQALSILLLGVALLSACQTEGQSSGVTTAPLALTPTDSPSELGSSTTDSNTTSTAVGTAKPVQPGVVFRDDFDGPAVDTSKWRVYEKSGVVRQRDGWLEAVSTAGGADFPFLVTASTIIPDSGGWYFETHAKWFNARDNSKVPSLNLDVLPPSSPDDEGYAAPMIQILPSYYKPLILFKTGAQNIEKPAVAEKNAPFTVRIECDLENNYQIYVNAKQLVTGKSSRRPKAFWLGHYPNSPIPSAEWLHWRIDYIETGVLGKKPPPLGED